MDRRTYSKYVMWEKLISGKDIVRSSTQFKDDNFCLSKVQLKLTSPQLKDSRDLLNQYHYELGFIQFYSQQMKQQGIALSQKNSHSVITGKKKTFLHSEKNRFVMF